MFRRIEYPETGLIDHASKIGVRLKSSSSLGARKRSYSPRETSAVIIGGTTVNRKPSAKSLMSARAKSSVARISAAPVGPVEYIHNVVIPIGVPDEVSSSPRPFTAFSGNSSLPRMKRVSHSARTTLSSVSNKMGSIPDLYGRVSASSDAEKKSLFVKSDQALRYQQEKENTEKGREMKKTSQVRSHRVDRMYYMCGTSLQIANRYEVDEDEIRRIKELILARKNTTINAAMSASYAAPPGSYEPDNVKDHVKAHGLETEPHTARTDETIACSEPPTERIMESSSLMAQNLVFDDITQKSPSDHSQPQTEAVSLLAMTKENVTETDEAKTEPDTARTDETIACSEPPTERMMESSSLMTQNLVFDDITQRVPSDQSQPQTEAVSLSAMTEENVAETDEAKVTEENEKPTDSLVLDENDPEIKQENDA